jgi:hypothetical protein
MNRESCALSNVKLPIANQRQIFSKKQEYVGYNLDPMKVFIFTSTKVFNMCLQSNLELKTLLGSTIKFQIVVGAT